MDPDAAKTLDEANPAPLPHVALRKEEAAIPSMKVPQFTGPSWLERMSDPNTSQQEKLDLASGFGGGGIGVAGTFVPAERSLVQTAERVLAKGVSTKWIWEKLGVFQGHDGLWRREISDADAAMPVGALPEQGAVPLDMVLDHPELFQAMPSLKNISVKRLQSDDQKLLGGYNPKDDTIHISPGDLGTMVHEIQHAIQERGGFAKGGSVELVRDYVKQALKAKGVKNPTPEMIEDLSRVMYRHLAGEVESRNVERRLDPAQAAQDPPTTEDVPRGLQITHGVGEDLFGLLENAR